MAEPYIGEIRMFGFGFQPQDWALCNGQTLAINQYQALFSVLGTTYGGDGINTFALPNLQGRIPYHTGGAFTLGQARGEESHQLTLAELAPHNHPARASSAAAPNQGSPAGNLWVQQSANAYGAIANATMNPAAIGFTGGGQAHENRPPLLVVNFCIALVGIFPSPN